MHSGLGGVTASIPGSDATKGRDIAFAVFRILLGGYWLQQQHWKLPPDFGLNQPRGLMFAFQEGINYPTLDIYRTLLQDIVVPNFHLFGWLLFLGESAIGISILLGLGTRIGSIAGTFQATNLLLSQASTPEGWMIYAVILAANVIVLFTHPNRRWSLDRVLAPRLDDAIARGNRLARLVRWAM